MNKRLARSYRFWIPVLTGGVVLWLLLAARGRAPAPPALGMEALSQRRLELPPPPRRIGTYELSGRVLAPDGRPVSWFVDGVFLGTVRADKPIWWQPKPGQHRKALAQTF